MRVKESLMAAALLGLASGAFLPLPAQEQPRRGGFVPGQKREPEDPAQVSRGKTLYSVNCRSCHGADLRGGDLGGPNLLRSQIALSDLKGEQLVPVIQNGRPAQGMPAFKLKENDLNALASYIRSEIQGIGSQGKPPESKEPPSILVGNAEEGKAYFAAKCASCHSVTGDLKGLATRINEPRKLQTTWVAGHGRFQYDDGVSMVESRIPKITVTLPSGETISGDLLHIDDFLLGVKLPDGSFKSIRRDGDVPQVVIKDPMQAHREMLPLYTDKDIHDVTAYLVTLK